MKGMICFATGLGALVLVTGCVAWTGPGPMNLDEHGGGYCAPTAHYSEMVIGIGLDGVPDSDITIQSVTADHHDGVDLVAAWLMPVGEEGHMGFLEFPPDDAFPLSWRRAILAEDAVVPAGEIWDLVLQVRSEDRTGGALSGITVRYAQDGFVHETHPKVEIEFSKDDCD